MAKASVSIQNLDVLARLRERVASLPDEGAKAIARAASTLKRRLVPFAKRDIGAQYNLPAGQIGKRLSASGDVTSVTLRGRGRPISLPLFRARQIRTGVQCEVEKGKPFEIAHAFIRVPTGRAAAAGPQVFIRNDAPFDVPSVVQDTARIEKDRHGYPILRLAGPGVADMLRDEGREDRIADFARETFAAEIDRLTEVARGK